MWSIVLCVGYVIVTGIAYGVVHEIRGKSPFAEDTPLQFMSIVFWPLGIAVGAGWLCAQVGRAAVRRWRSRDGGASTLPKAQAREKTP